MRKIETDFIEGGYVINERNQLQESSTIFFNLPGRSDSFKSVVFDS